MNEFGPRNFAAISKNYDRHYDDNRSREEYYLANRVDRTEDEQRGWV